MNEKDFNYNFLTKQIIGYTPRWITRWGITIILLIFILLGIILSSIKYPISVSGNATIVYERVPATILTPSKSIFLKTHQKDGSYVKKGSVIMSLDNGLKDDKEIIYAPVSGILYLSNNWRPNSSLNKNDVLGFIVPMPNERIIKIKINSERSSKIKVGRKVIVTVNNGSGINLRLSGRIDFISPKLMNSRDFINIRLSPEAKTAISSSEEFLRSDKIPCVANLTLDTTTYLRHILHK